MVYAEAQGLRYTTRNIENVIGLGTFSGVNLNPIKSFDSTTSEDGDEILGMRAYLSTRPYVLIVIDAPESEVEILLADLNKAVESGVYNGRRKPTVAIVDGRCRRASDSIDFVVASRFGSIIDLGFSGAINYRTPKRDASGVGN